MDLQTFGRNVLDLLADRALTALRTASYDGVCRLAAVPARPPQAPSGSLSAFAAGAVLGAGFAALTTPVTGSELRQHLIGATQAARRSAADLGGSVGTHWGAAREAMRVSQSATPARARATRSSPLASRQVDGAAPAARDGGKRAKARLVGA